MEAGKLLLGEREEAEMQVAEGKPSEAALLGADLNDGFKKFLKNY